MPESVFIAQAQWVIPILQVMALCFLFGGIPAVIAFSLAFTRHRRLASVFAILGVVVGYLSMLWMIVFDYSPTENVYLLLVLPMFVAGLALFISLQFEFGKK